ncbi:MAG TPA: hypothetical protein VM657_00815 [Sphingomonas sp.]|nr:hypothetical protein [Sphingomonas sp.]
MGAPPMRATGAAGATAARAYRAAAGIEQRDGRGRAVRFHPAG